ncbi:MAG TPA: sugar transferase [Terracidiphilus sp.]|nr:sugar transferase [Terracidiphilus sp.]
MDGNDKRVEACGGGELINGHLARTRFLTRRVSIGISSELYRMSHSEIEEPSDAKDVAPKYELSPWVRSGAKRAMDVGIVLASCPILIPVFVAIALAVLVTSGAPIFFLQERLGPHGVPFDIYKFRTMRPALVHPSSAIAIDSADRVTWLGGLLRRSKLDELPQIIHVLTGEMSLVGPRPKVPEQEPEPFPCRPGLTGVATLAFAREEMILQGIASARLNDYFQTTVLGAKRALDADYLRRATMWSDLRILVNTVLGRWEAYDRVTCRLQDDGSDLEASSETASLSR